MEILVAAAVVVIALSDDEATKKLAKDDLIQCEGRVAEANGQGNYRIHLNNGVEVNGRLCGRMKRFKIRILVGDRVTIGLSPYDLTHGLITHRH